MHVEIQVALNFFISFLYNKLPRRRVNQFGEELERALKRKFVGHWYPEKPFKGSAFRCLKTAMPLDPIFEVAAHESGMALADIQENLPEELSIWIDPGEVSYRMGEKGCAKMLYSECGVGGGMQDEDREEMHCFRPIDSVASQLAGLSLSGASSPFTAAAPSPSPTASPPAAQPHYGGPKNTTPLTFTTATFAQTKFGSTKLKSSGKRSHRMSPTEFSSYIKQRALIQQQQQPLLSPAAPGDNYLLLHSFPPFPPEDAPLLSAPRNLSLILDNKGNAAAPGFKSSAAEGKGYDAFGVGSMSYPNQHLLMAN